jgi:hypothetical protein
MTKCNSVNAALISRLRAAGCPMPSENQADTEPGLMIKVTRPEKTIAYDARAGADYAFAVRIENQSYGSLVLQRFQARLPWPTCLRWLGDPRIHVPEKTVYRFENTHLEFPCEQVLNHRVREQGTIEPGGTLEGILLAFTIFDRIPFDYLHGDSALARLSIVDQYEREHLSEIELLIDRSATMRLLRSMPRVSLMTAEDPTYAGGNGMQPDRQRVSDFPLVTLEGESAAEKSSRLDCAQSDSGAG